MGGESSLALDQAPPLSVPLAFFLTAPLALLVAAALLATTANSALISQWSPLTVALTHTGTLGWLGTVMLGALYQMIPVVGGRPVPGVRLAHLVHGLLFLGLVGLIGGLWLLPALLPLGWVALCAAFTLFLPPVLWALLTCPTQDLTVQGMRLALLGLLSLVVLGLTMLGSTLGWFPGLDKLAALRTHAIVALMVWVGGLLTAVSWQVVPMFYMTASWPARANQLTLLALLLTLVGAWISVFLYPSAQGALLAATPAGLALWALQPALGWQAITARRRKRAGASRLFWQAGYLFAPVAGLLGLAALLRPEPLWPILWGWVTIWGWAGLIVHGMLTRILPFLVWFHRFSSLVGLVKVPSMRSLWPERWAKIGLGLHVSTTLLGAAAISLESPLVAKMTALGLTAVALSLWSGMLTTLRRPVPERST